jgi:hypothetical protein
MEVVAKKVAYPSDLPAALSLEPGGTVLVEFPAEPGTGDGLPEMQWVAGTGSVGGSVQAAGSTVTLTGLTLTSGHRGEFRVPVGSDLRLELPASPMRWVGLRAAEGATLTIVEES